MLLVSSCVLLCLFTSKFSSYTGIVFCLSLAFSVPVLLLVSFQDDLFLVSMCVDCIIHACVLKRAHTT